MAPQELKGFRLNNDEILLNAPPRFDGGAQNNDDHGSTILSALTKAEKQFDADIVVYNGPINEDGYGQFVQATKNVKPERKLMLVLVTYGGSADSAYRIARYAQNFFKDFLLFVPNACKSAGTLIALGASRIHMSPFGEFGPLDVQVFKSDEIFERRSGLTSKSAVWSLTEEAFKTFEQILLALKMRSGGTITFKSASQLAASIATGLLSPVASQLDPLSLGEDYQNLHIAHEYGDRLVEKFHTVNANAVLALVENYPSHGFVIDLFEAVELLGNVEMACKELIHLQACLPLFCSKPDPREVRVFRVRDTFEEEDDHDRKNNRTTESPDTGGSGEVSRRNQQSERSDRSRHKKAGAGSDQRRRPSPSSSTTQPQTTPMKPSGNSATSPDKARSNASNLSATEMME